MAQPAVEELILALKGTIPLLNGKYKEVNGQMMPRLQAPPHDASKEPNYIPADDPHADGRALDIFLFVNEPTEKIIGENIFAMFNAMKPDMNWTAIIFNRVIVDDFGGPKLYGGRNPHTTHIHIEWSPSKAKTTGFKNSIWDELKQINDDSANGSLQSVNISKLGKIEVGNITIVN